MVDVHSENNSQVVNVVPVDNTQNVPVTPTSNTASVIGSNDKAKYYSDLAKHYAELAESYADNADTSADNALVSATSADTSADNAEVWAEGTDEEVEALGGTHSSKGWVNYVLTNPPTASVEQTETGATITITDINGTTTATVLNGADGQDGYSPTATVSKTGSIATITITDKNGTTTAQVSDGVGAITDVQQNGVSVVSSGIANVIVPDAQIQSDWSQSDNTQKDYIKNKPTIPTIPTALSSFTDDLGSNPVHTHSQYGSARNIGEVVASTIPLTDAGLHLLDGSLLQYGSYKAFIDYIADLYTSGDYDDIFDTEANWQTSVTTYGTCGKFVYDSNDNTVRLPKVTGFIEGTTDVTALGDLVEAGLPNIIGTINFVADIRSDDISGRNTLISNSIDTKSDRWASLSTSESRFYAESKTIDASLSSSIYGNSSTVQPQTIKVLYYIVIATSTKTDIQVDIDEIATDLNGKADRDLSNLSATGENHFVNKDLSNLSATGINNLVQYAYELDFTNISTISTTSTDGSWALYTSVDDGILVVDAGGTGDIIAEISDNVINYSLSAVRSYWSTSHNESVYFPMVKGMTLRYRTRGSAVYTIFIPRKKSI